MKPDAPDKPNAPAGEGAPSKAAHPRLGSGGVALRFGMRMLILLAFANVGTIGFAKTLESLLAMAAIYCAGIAPLRREVPFGPVLTNFDEAAAYALCALIVSKAG